ncbi:two-component system, NarL family, sensor histidine kinase DesK [Nonomuraea solani]|uniref:Two-component system, NarL family, sensor histidine kinase DesK n=1 Tax=Nonomuraea solani TaxID=1144553 RepID=A0A1H5ZJR4_9ACTN|nr:histidine kinase [Nonomuraea solani]SEG36461.1 two-component system, NarL family, sensor histidine kinase DesK [Nonomuraea solani]
MAARPETARRILLYWMDATMGFLGIVFALLAVLHWTGGAISLAHLAAVLACQAGFFGLFPILLRRAYDGRPRRPSPLLLVAGLFAAGALALLPHQVLTDTPSWVEVGALWVSVAAIYLPLPLTACVGAGVLGLTSAWVSFVTGRSWSGVLISQSLSAVAMVAAMLLWRWLWWTIRDAYDGKEAKARLAVAEERLRFARDLHDLLGHSLSVITLKSELAAKLATKDGGRAAAEMADVRHLADDALAEVQLAVDGYRALDLDEELASVRAALEAAGTRCVVDARADGLSPAARALLAWAVREGGTNVLKHSTAGRCTITIDGGVLEMRNDGVRGLPSEPGNGLRGLSERLVTAGGSFSAEPTPTGEFLLRAAVRG